VLVGWVGPNPYGNRIMPTGWRYNAQPRRLLTFALDGKASLPSSAPRDMAVHPVAVPDYAVAAADVPKGRELYTWNCAICHGINVVSSGAPAPDLRESGVAAARDSLWQVVSDGLLVERGMPRFEKLSRQEVDLIYNYIRHAADQARR